MLHEQCISDMFQDCPAAPGSAAMFRQLPCERLDDIEDSAHISLVVRQDHIRCDRISDD